MIIYTVDGSSSPTGNCSSGWYCSGGSYMAEPVATNTTCQDCYCPDANLTGGRCPPGSYCPLGSSYPRVCDGGSYCGVYGLSAPSGPCDAGYYCDGGEILPNPTTGLCPPGYYCEQQSTTPTPCPAG